MRAKKPIHAGLDYRRLFREPINKLHKEFDAKHGVEKVEECCNYVLRVLQHPDTYTGPNTMISCLKELASWHWTNPDLLLKVMTTLRRHWFNASGTFKVQIFLSLHPFITTDQGRFISVEAATDGELSSAIDDYWEQKISLATVKKARQLMTAKGKQ
jgi:hypothetical protein